MRQLFRLAAPGWWRRPPFLPLPDPDYLRFRLQTAYGDDRRAPDPADVITYLHWCRQWPSRAAVMRHGVPSTSDTASGVGTVSEARLTDSGTSHARPRDPRGHRGRRHRRAGRVPPTSPSPTASITEVGEVDGAGASDASTPTALLVTPGFVDVHTHYDGQVTWDPQLTPSCWHGVTTVVMGNCGVGFAPVQPDKHEWLIGLMEGVEDIPGAALSEGIQWGWETLPRVPRRARPHAARCSTSARRCRTARCAAT